MKIGIITDSASDINFEFAEINNIGVVPMTVFFHNKEFKESKDFDLGEYYKNFEREKVFRVTTSQPSPGEFLEKYEKYTKDGYSDIFVITVSSGLSGTYNSATIAKDQFNENFPDVNIHLIDSITASVGVRNLVELAFHLIKEGKSVEDIKQALEIRKSKQRTILTLPTLKYLRAGGRVSMPKFLIGAFLGLKPITMMKNGKNEAVGTSRSMDKGIQKVYDLATDKGINLAESYSIAHTNDLNLAKNLEKIIREKQPEVPVRINLVRTSLSAHTGPGGLALITIHDDQVIPEF